MESRGFPSRSGDSFDQGKPGHRGRRVPGRRFLINGLKDGRRVLLEFRGLGHDISVGNLYEWLDPSNWSKRFAGLLEDFIKTVAKCFAISRRRPD